MICTKNRSLKVVIILMLCTLPCIIQSEANQNILAYLLSHHGSSVKTNIPNSQRQPVLQKSTISQTNTHPNGMQTTDYFDNNNKNIARVEKDRYNNIIYFINFYADGTQSKTNYNSDGSQTISFFDINRKNTSITKLDKNGNITATTQINPDKTTIETTYHNDKSKTIITFNAQGKSSSKTEINREGIMTAVINFNHDGTQTHIAYNADKSKTISVYGVNNKINSMTEINSNNKPIKHVEFHDDGSQSTTTYHTDATQTINHRDKQGKRISLTRVHAHGAKVYATNKQIIAWHEAAHAISHTHNDTLSLINYITIKAEEVISKNGETIKTDGHVQASRKTNINTTIEEIDNKIITAICGAVGEQILMHNSMLNDPQEILELLAQPPYTDDMIQGRNDAKEILIMQGSQNDMRQLDKKIDEILIRLYKKAYTFILKHKDEVKKIADVLIEKETLTRDETYKILNLKQPLLQ